MEDQIATLSAYDCISIADDGRGMSDIELLGTPALVERARELRVYPYSGSSVRDIAIDGFNEMSTAISLEKFPNDSFIPDFIKCLFHVEKLGVGVLTMVERSSDSDEEALPKT